MIFLLRAARSTLTPPVPLVMALYLQIPTPPFPKFHHPQYCRSEYQSNSDSASRSGCISQLKIVYHREGPQRAHSANLLPELQLNCQYLKRPILRPLAQLTSDKVFEQNPNN